MLIERYTIKWATMIDAGYVEVDAYWSGNIEWAVVVLPVL